MGRSPRTVFPRTVTLEEAFRRILRGMFPDQPSLADKIPTRSGWELPYPKYDITLPKHVRTLIGRKEVKAIKKMVKIKAARESFGRLVARKEVKLRGTLDPRKPLEDIDPADAEVGMVHILAGELRVFLNGKLVRTYHQVRCYETDVNSCVTELRSETKHAKAGKLTDEELLQLQPEFVKDYLAPFSANSAPRPTVTELHKKWKDAGHGARRRDDLDEVLEKQAKDKGILLKPGRQKKHAR
jgi:hypothetical protein